MRRDVEQDHVHLGGVLDEGRALNGCTERDDLVRVNALARLALEEGADLLLDLRHAGHAADQHDVLDLVLLEARFVEGHLANLGGAIDQITGEVL